jgi:hypothetical protein
VKLINQATSPIHLINTKSRIQRPFVFFPTFSSLFLESYDREKEMLSREREREREEKKQFQILL